MDFSSISGAGLAALAAAGAGIRKSRPSDESANAAPAEAPTTSDGASASAIPRKPSSKKPRRHPDDELLAQWEAFKARQGVNEDRVVILDFYEAELKGRTDLNLSGVEKAIENGRQRRSRAKRKTHRRR